MILLKATHWKNYSRSSFPSAIHSKHIILYTYSFVCFPRMGTHVNCISKEKKKVITNDKSPFSNRSVAIPFWSFAKADQDVAYNEWDFLIVRGTTSHLIGPITVSIVIIFFFWTNLHYIEQNGSITMTTHVLYMCLNCN